MIKELKSSLNIEDVISRYLPVRKRGANLVGLCPFHSEKTPSFTVSQQMQRFHCFGCGADGDVIDFLQKVTGQSFSQVVSSLGVEKETRFPGPTSKPRSVFKPLKARLTPSPLSGDVLERYTSLQAHLEGAKDYLSGRRIPLEVAAEVGAGFLGAKEVFSTIRGPCLVLPHTVPDGSIVSLYGRSIDPAARKEDRHRHLRLPKGLLNAPALLLPGPLYLVEGAFDLLAMRAAGVQKVVAVWGLEAVDLRWFSRQTEVILALDRDDAGQQASIRLREQLRYLGAKVTDLDFDGKDVAEAWAAGSLTVSPSRLDCNADLKRKMLRLGDAPEPHLNGGWSMFVAAMARFSQHIDEALTLGWTLESLFSLPWSPLGTGAGAVWSLADFGALRVERDRITAGVVAFKRGSPTSGNLPQALLEAL
jgi:DNA primase